MGLNSRIIDFSEVHRTDEDLVGKKAHELGMLWKLRIPIPNGFVITTQFFKEFLRLTGIDKEIKKTQVLKHPALSDSFDKLFYPVQKKIMQTHIPQALTSELHKFYRKHSGIFKNRSLNIFSSSSSNKSIVYRNVKGDANLVLKIKTMWSMSPESPIAIAVQENIDFGIKGKITTDNPAAAEKLTKEQIDKLVQYCKIIQKHFYFPKEIEYTLNKGKIFITRVKPFTGIANEFPKQTFNKKTRKVLTVGISINPGIATGPVKILHNRHMAVEIKRGDVIALPNLDFFLFKKMKNAKALVADSILQNSLDKTLYRKYFQIPTIVGAKNATKILKNGNVVTVNGITGEIYSGGLVY